MKKLLPAAGIALALILAAGGGYWFGRQQAPATMPATQAAAAGDSLEFLRYSLKRKTPERGDPYYYVDDDEDERVRAHRPVQQVCLDFNLPLAKAETYQGQVKAEGIATLTLSTEQRTLCLAGWPEGTKRLDLVLPAGLPAAEGATMAAETRLRVELDIPAAEKLVAFAGNGAILPRIGATGIAVETRNVDRIRLRVLRVSDARLMRDWPKHRAKRKAGNDDGEEDYSYDNSLDRLITGGAYTLWDGTMAVENRGGERSLTSFPLGNILPRREPGAYLLIAEEDAKASARSGYSSWNAPATRWVIETDIGLTILQGEDGLHVLARSYDSAKPLPGLELALVAENGRDLGRATSNGDGRVLFAPGLLQGQEGNRPQAVFAYGSDGAFAFIDLNRPAFDLSDRGVSGQPALRPLTAFLYADRGIYRPGERVQLSGLLRRDTADALAEPLTLVIQRPNGAEFRRHTLRPDAGGGVHLSAELPPGAARGLWSVQAYADPTGQPIGRLSFEVQDFVPQRLGVSGMLDQPVYNPAAPPRLDLAAQWLYGAPAAELQAFGELRITRDGNAFPQWSGWHFGRHDDPFEDVLLKLDADATDAEGRASITLAESKLGSTLPLKAIVGFGVYEPGGRATEERLSLPVRHRPVFLGIKPGFDDNRVPNGTEAQLGIAAIDAEGKQIARPGIAWRLEREVWSYIWYRDAERGGRWAYRVSVQMEPIQSGTWTLAADKPQDLRFKPEAWNRYRLTVEDPDGGAATSYRFATGFGNTSPDDEIPDKVAVSADAASYAIGTTARVAIKPPFAGEALVMVASNRILWSRHVSLPAEGGEVEIPVTAEWGAGAYILVDLVRPLSGGSAREPVRAIGLTWASLDNGARQLAVSLAAPEVALPQSRLTLPVTIAGLAPGQRTTLTVAAVDEGILALTRFVSPDPADFYFGKRRLGIDLRDDYGRLLDGQAAPAGRIRMGGDDMGGAGLQTVPTRTVALFSGPVEVDAEGKASISFDLPDFVGQLRLMAVAYNQRQVGKGEARLRVRHPLVADAYFPRFLAPGDKARMTLHTQNVEAPEGEYRFTVSATPGLDFTGPTELTLPLAARQSAQGSFELAAQDDFIGIATIRLGVSGPGGVAFNREWQIESRSPHYPLTLESRRDLNGGEALTLNPDLLTPFLPGGAALTVNLSAIRGIDVPGLLQSLYRYPYGCTEQITSVAAPLLAFGDFSLLGTGTGAGTGTGKVLGDDDLRRRVQQAVDTLLDRQGEDGVIGLWRANDRSADSWLIVYATDFLQRAQQQGYVVPDDALRRAGKFLRNLAEQSGSSLDYDIYGYGDAARANLLRARAYAHYLLARNGDPQRSLLLRQQQEFEQATPGIARSFFAAALALAGERERAGAIFRQAAGLIGSAQAVNFYGSRLRDEAVAAALMTESLGLAAAAPFFDRLAATPAAAEKLTTQEKAWLLRAASAAKRDASIILDDNGTARRYSNVAAQSLSIPPAALTGGYRIVNNGEAPLSSSVILHGAPRQAPPALANGYRLSKQVFDPAGDPVNPGDPAAVRRHDRLIVVLEGQVQDAQYRQNILVDMLPAGWEIESVLRPPRKLDDSPAPYAWLPALSPSLMMEQRDDRFVAAFELNSQERTNYFAMLLGDDADMRARLLPPGRDFRFAYVVRAVTPGSFTLPAASVEDMYRPERMARSAAGHTMVRAD